MKQALRISLTLGLLVMMLALVPGGAAYAADTPEPAGETILLLGDSYGGPPGAVPGWIAYVEQWMPDKTIYSAYIGGSGLASTAGIKFQTLIEALTEGYLCPIGTAYYRDAERTEYLGDTTTPYTCTWVNETTQSVSIKLNGQFSPYYVATEDCTPGLTAQQRESITTILINAGMNDCRQTPEHIIEGIDNFCTYASIYYPNATVLLTLCQCSTHEINGANLMQVVANSYMMGVQATTNGAMIQGSQYSLHRYDYLKTDKIHPTAEACYVIAASIVNVLRCGLPLPPDNTLLTTNYIASGDATEGTATVQCSNQEAISYAFVSFDLTADLSDGAWHEVATADALINFSGSSLITSPMMTVQANVDGGLQQTQRLEIRWNLDKMYVRLAERAPEITETLTISGNQVITSKIAVNSDFSSAYIVDADGNPGETLTRGGSRSPGVFTYNPDTGIVGFNPGDYLNGTQVVLSYREATPPAPHRYSIEETLLTIPTSLI